MAQLDENIAFREKIKTYWPLIFANGFYYFFTGISASVIAKKEYEILPPQLISVQSIVGWSGGIVLAMVWTKWNKRLFFLLVPFYVMQAAASILYFAYSEATLNMFVFWVLGLGMYVCFGGISDKIFEGACAWFFKEPEKRAEYDNLTSMSSSIAGLSGYAISVFYVPSLRAAILFNFLATFLWCLGILLYSLSNKALLKDTGLKG